MSFVNRPWREPEYKEGVVIVDCDGEILVIRLPGLGKKKFWDYNQNVFQRYAEQSSVFKRQKCRKTRGNVELYLEPTTLSPGEEGYSPGCVHLAYWHAMGHTKSSPQLSTDLVASSVKKVNHSQKFLGNSTGLQHLVNGILEKLDPSQAKRLMAVCQQMDRNPSTCALLHNQACHLHSLAFLSNKMTGGHLDRHSRWDVFDAMLAGGDFTGGDLYLDELRMSMPFLPGDFIFIRGKVLTHGTRKWEGKKRASLVFFVHDAVIDHEESRAKEAEAAEEERRASRQAKAATLNALKVAERWA